jgi:hypothetical protein
MTQNTVPSRPPPEPFDRKRFRSLLGMYALGLAIGFTLLGMFWAAKHRAAQAARQQQQQQGPAGAQQGQPAPPATGP